MSYKTGGYNGVMNSVVGEAVYNNAFDRAIRNGDSPDIAKLRAEATVRNVAAGAKEKFIVEEASVWQKVGTSAGKGAVLGGTVCVGAAVFGGPAVAGCPLIALGAAAVGAGQTVLDLFWRDPGATIKINPAWDGKATISGPDVQLGDTEQAPVYADVTLPTSRVNGYARSLMQQGYQPLDTFVCKNGTIFRSCIIVPVVTAGYWKNLVFPSGSSVSWDYLSVFSPKSMSGGSGGTYNSGTGLYTYFPSSAAAAQAFCTLGGASANPCYDVIDDDGAGLNSKASGTTGYILAMSEVSYASASVVPRIRYKPKDQSWVTLASLLNSEPFQKYKNSALSDGAIAKVADHLYKGSHQPDGVPYSDADPVSSSNVSNLTYSPRRVRGLAGVA